MTTINQGQIITINCDGCEHSTTAKISHIASKPEYSPPVIYSNEAREKLVYMVDATLDKKDLFLHPGLPVDIYLEGE